jgi:hypothetical protein
MANDKPVKTEEAVVSVQPESILFADKSDLDALDYDALVELGRSVSEVKTYAQWVLGKLGDKAMQKWGDLEKYAKDIGMIYEVLQQYMNTYRKFVAEDPAFTPDRYFGGVPWGLLQMVATKSDTPITLLNEMVDQGATTIPQAYKKIKEKETGKTLPNKPRVNLKLDEESGKWKIKILPEEMDMIDWTDIKEQLVNYLNSLT